MCACVFKHVVPDQLKALWEEAHLLDFYPFGLKPIWPKEFWKEAARAGALGPSGEAHLSTWSEGLLATLPHRTTTKQVGKQGTKAEFTCLVTHSVRAARKGST